MSAIVKPETTIYLPSTPSIIIPSPTIEIATPDFISSYAAYADVFEMPRQVHEWMAVQLIASVLNGRVWIEWGSRIPLDLWVLLLSGSGQGRNTATDVALGVIGRANIPSLLRKATWGSSAAFYQQLAEAPRGLYVWPELSVALKKLNDRQFAGVKEWVTDRYDNLGIPEAIAYRKTGKASDTPTIEFTEAPRINILATSSSDWFVNNIQESDTLGGFVPRWLPKQVGKSDRVIPKPVTPDPDLLPSLGDQLTSIAGLSGPADLSSVEGSYFEWYGETRERFFSQPNSALAEPFFNRLRNELLKLAVIFEVSQSGSLKVTLRAFQRAVEAASDAERTIMSLLPSGLTREGSEVERMAEKIRSSGPDGISKSELTRAFQSWDNRAREERLRTLVESGRVRTSTRFTSGRSSMRLIHEDYSAASEAAS